MDQPERTAVVAPIKANIPSLAMDEAELMKVLQSSIYPGATPESIKLVIGYCRAGQLDPLQKPVHIVPMSVKVKGRDGQKDSYEWRDVIMPGVGLYRTQASRSQQCAGVSEPEFGPDEEFKAGEFSMNYPKWCRVTVRRLVSGNAVDFTAVEFWKENYATAGKDTIVPNAMWKKRPYGQLAKCAEAQALRKAFPEFVGAAVTAEEMEGKPLDDVALLEHQTVAREEKKPTGPQPYPAEGFEKNLPAWRKLIESGAKTAEQIIATVSSKGTLTEAQKAAITGKPTVDKTTGETTSLLDQVQRICASAIAITDADTAFLRLDDARVLLPEMLPENKAAAVKEIDAANEVIKGRTS